MQGIHLDPFGREIEAKINEYHAYDAVHGWRHQSKSQFGLPWSRITWRFKGVRSETASTKQTKDKTKKIFSKKKKTESRCT